MGGCLGYFNAYLNDSAKPTTQVPTEIVLAMVNIMPIEPPMAGPRVLQNSLIPDPSCDIISPGYDIVHPSSGYFAITGDGGQGQSGEPGDHITQGDHHQALAIIRKLGSVVRIVHLQYTLSTSNWSTFRVFSEMD